MLRKAFSGLSCLFLIACISSIEPVPSVADQCSVATNNGMYTPVSVSFSCVTITDGSTQTREASGSNSSKTTGCFSPNPPMNDKRGSFQFVDKW